MRRAAAVAAAASSSSSSAAVAAIPLRKKDQVQRLTNKRTQTKMK